MADPLKAASTANQAKPRFAVAEGRASQKQSSGRADWYELGHGVTGTVFRVVPAKREPRIKKVYGSALDHVSDRATLRLLRKATRGSDDVSVVKPRRSLGWKTMTTPDVRGQPLSVVLADKNLDPQDRKQLLERYEQFQRHLQNKLQKRWPKAEIDDTASGLQAHVPFRVMPLLGHAVAIKPDSVIVDPVTLKMTLVDPQ